MNISVVPKQLFFDRPKVVALMDKTTRRILGRFGALTRKIERQSIRRRKSSSRPGQPPHAHAKGNDGLKLVYFAVDPAKRDVVIGPVGFKAADGTPVPELLDRGGTVTRRIRGRTRRQTYRARPFAEPAGREAIKQLPEITRKVRIGP